MEDNKHLLQEHKLLKSALDNIYDGITVIDKDLKIIFHNEAIRKKFGDVTDKLCYAAYRNRSEPCADCLVFEVMKDLKQRKMLRDVHLPNGDVMWMECMSGPLTNDKGEVIGAVEIVRNVTEQMRLSKECVTLKREMERQFQFENIITQSIKMKSIFSLIERIAPTTSTVLITGESGTGKGLVARAIHHNSTRSNKPFVSINCGAIPENLLESELFGHVKGAFTGAVSNHKGLIASAEGGTLFLDEVGELPLSLQVKLLHFLQEGTYRPVGDTQVKNSDVRILCATNCNLEEAVKEKLFREDLYFRLNVIPIYLPPLRDRKEDITPLANHLLQKFCDLHKRTINGVSSDTLKYFLEYPWPGNIREMENVMEYAVHLADNNELIQERHLPPKILSYSKESSTVSYGISIEEFTKNSILALQDSCSEEEIASSLGISRKNLWEKRKRWSIPRPMNS